MQKVSEKEDNDRPDDDENDGPSIHSRNQIVTNKTPFGSNGKSSLQRYIKSSMSNEEIRIVASLKSSRTFLPEEEDLIGIMDPFYFKSPSEQIMSGKKALSKEIYGMAKELRVNNKMS